MADCEDMYMKKKIFKKFIILFFIVYGISYIVQSDEPFLSAVSVLVSYLLIYYFYQKKKKKSGSGEQQPASASYTPKKRMASSEIIKECEVAISETTHDRKDSDQMPDIKFTNVTKRTNLEKLSNFVALDLETTGLDPDKHRIIEVSAVRFINWEPVESFHTLIDPMVRIPKRITEINGITNEMIAGSPKFNQVIDSLSQFIGKDNIVGHNLIFDLRFLFCSGYDFSTVKSRKYYDTLSIVKYVLSKDGKYWNSEDGCYDYDYGKIDVENYKLTTLCDYYGIRDNSGAHRALSDSLAVGKLFYHLVDDKLYE